MAGRACFGSRYVMCSWEFGGIACGLLDTMSWAGFRIRNAERVGRGDMELVYRAFEGAALARMFSAFPALTPGYSNTLQRSVSSSPARAIAGYHEFELGQILGCDRDIGNKVGLAVCEGKFDAAEELLRNTVSAHERMKIIPRIRALALFERDSGGEDARLPKFLRWDSSKARPNPMSAER
jgi:hypothetical protein